MKDNSKKIETTATRKEWRKNKRRAARTRRKEAKKAASEKQASTPKRYDLLAQYHPTLSNDVREIIKENNLKYAVLTDAYFVISNLSEGSCKEIESAFEECKLSCGENRKPKTVRFARWKSKTIIHEEKNRSRATNNTDEVKKAARARRKEKNINNFRTRKTREQKAAEGRTRKAKIVAFRAKRNKGNKVTRASKETTLQKKLRQRATKAGKYLVKKETKSTAAPKKKEKAKKPVQQKINFAA